MVRQVDSPTIVGLSTCWTYNPCKQWRSNAWKYYYKSSCLSWHTLQLDSFELRKRFTDYSFRSNGQSKEIVATHPRLGRLFCDTDRFESVSVSVMAITHQLISCKQLHASWTCLFTPKLIHIQRVFATFDGLDTSSGVWWHPWHS